MPEPQRLIVIADADGSVIAATSAAPVENGEVSTTLAPLEGQTMHEVEVPAMLSRSSGEESQVLLDVLGYRLTADRTTLVKKGG
ncbi:hypothetical protein OHT76_00285 [Streptomyces sp. NBC_00287]|uniref:hypothetical protein n=1 Tax=Streptomyces sp. NBC_00287 TaxID=2975702 RepID=UPI002E2B18A3|nr:hypothetical protein [Streptomyces sp. NBC_00287]